MLAIWVMGWVNWRTYWMNAWMSPTVMAPPSDRKPPSTQMATYPRLPAKFISGIMTPPRNWLFHAAVYSWSLRASNVRTLSSSPQKAETTVCPPYISSTCPFTWPR